VFYRCDIVKVFDNLTVGDSVKYFMICAVSFPFLRIFFTFRLCVDILYFIIFLILFPRMYVAL
jgi:hypothetical protein